MIQYVKQLLNTDAASNRNLSCSSASSFVGRAGLVTCNCEQKDGSNSEPHCIGHLCQCWELPHSFGGSDTPGDLVQPIFYESTLSKSIQIACITAKAKIAIGSLCRTALVFAGAAKYFSLQSGSSTLQEIEKLLGLMTPSCYQFNAVTRKVCGVK